MPLWVGTALTTRLESFIRIHSPMQLSGRTCSIYITRSLVLWVVRSQVEGQGSAIANKVFSYTVQAHF